MPLSTITQFEYGFLHRPLESSGNALALTHGAGVNCDALLLRALAEAFASAGILVYRYNLPFRRKRSHGPPLPAFAAEDRAGVQEAVRALRSLAPGRILAGGHSYGGRQTSMAAAEDPTLCDGLLLLSYPLHPPCKPQQLRTAHFPQIRIKTLFVHGTRDPFGSIDELENAIRAIPALTRLERVESAGHDLKSPAGFPQISLEWLTE